MERTIKMNEWKQIRVTTVTTTAITNHVENEMCKSFILIKEMMEDRSQHNRNIGRVLRTVKLKCAEGKKLNQIQREKLDSCNYMMRELVFSCMFLIKCSICFYFHVIVTNCLPLINEDRRRDWMRERQRERESGENGKSNAVHSTQISWVSYL